MLGELSEEGKRRRRRKKEKKRRVKRKMRRIAFILLALKTIVFEGEVRIIFTRLLAIGNFINLRCICVK